MLTWKEGIVSTSQTTVDTIPKSRHLIIDIEATHTYKSQVIKNKAAPDLFGPS